MNSNIFEILEFDKIISHLTSLAVSPLGKEYIDQLAPCHDLPLIQQKLSEVSELREIIDFDDPFPIHGLKDIRASLKKLEE